MKGRKRMRQRQRLGRSRRASRKQAHVVLRKELARKVRSDRVIVHCIQTCNVLSRSKIAIVLWFCVSRFAQLFPDECRQASPFLFASAPPPLLQKPRKSDRGQVSGVNPCFAERVGAGGQLTSTASARLPAPAPPYMRVACVGVLGKSCCLECIKLNSQAAKSTM